MKELYFYGNENADVTPADKRYSAVGDPRRLYGLLSRIWCSYTCAPRLREGWSRENITLGQCSITAFLAQDIFGGEVRGILRPGGNYHCYNVVDGCVFDLTSEQFGDEVLDYSDNPVQLREVHFAKEEKRQRYEYLRHELNCLLELEERLMTINVVCGLPVSVSGSKRDITMIPFTGDAEGSLFSGSVVGSGIDTQTFEKDGTCRLSARYMLSGEDAEGRGCKIFVENNSAPDGSLSPSVVTDSPMLADWEGAPLTAHIEPTEKGVRVRIYRSL